MVLLIPRRIEQIKEEGRQEGRAEVREARAQDVREGIAEGIEEGIAEGRAQERELVARILALYDRGEITFEQLYTLLSFRNILERGGD